MDKIKRVEELGALTDARCVVIDLDGTLLHDDKKIGKASIEELLRLQRQGIHLVIATGRPRCYIPSLPEAVHIDYYITSNGSMIYDHDFHAVFRKCIEPEALRRVLKCFTKDQIVQYFIEGNVHLERWGLEHMDEYDVPPSYRHLLQTEGILHEDFAADYEKQGFACEKVNILFRHPYDRVLIEKLRSEILQIPGVASVSGGVENLEVMDKRVNKAEAVAFVLERLGLDIRHAVGFGDSENDMELFAAVKYGIAMENACEALKKQAAAVTKSNTDDGVAYALRYLFP